MELIHRIDINLVAIVLLGIVVFLSAIRLNIKQQTNRIYVMTCVIVIMQLIVETTTCIINRRPGEIMILMAEILHVILFSLAPILTYTWLLMIKTLTMPSFKIQRIWNIVLIAPVIFNLILAILSPFYGLIFSIDELNVYRRGDYFFLSASICYFYLVFAIVDIIRYRKHIVKTEIPLFLIATAFPIVGAIFQSLFYGMLLMWASAGFALVFGYIFLQQRLIHLDNMTGCWSRESFESFFERRILKEPKNHFGAIFFDIDHLKHINDTYGHLEGDNAIKETIALIKSRLSGNDILARIGGDEFIIIIETTHLDHLERTILNFQQIFDAENLKAHRPYQLSCSFGCDIFSSEFATYQHFLKHLDHLMYHNKATEIHEHPNVT